MMSTSQVVDSCASPSSTPAKTTSQGHPDPQGGFGGRAVGQQEPPSTHHYPSLDAVRVLTGKVATYLSADLGTNIQMQQWTLSRASTLGS